MLLQFTFENHRSFRDPASLSFVATSRKDEPSWRMASPYTANGVLPVLGLWGANASGKSNAIHALLTFRAAVKDSHARWGATQAVPWWPWGQRKGTDAPPSRFEIDLQVDEFRYAFGFAVCRGAFVEEHLLRWEGSRKQVLYSRTADENNPWHFGTHLKGQRTRIAEETRANSLFLSAAAQSNHPMLLGVYKAIVDGIKPERRIGLNGFPLFGKAHPILDPAFRESLLTLLKAADVGISDVVIERPQRVPMPDDIVQMLKPEVAAKFETIGDKDEDLHFIRLVHGNENWVFSPDEESRGTQILLARLADLVASLRRGGLLVLDEIDTSLHPDLCSALVGLFTNQQTNPGGAQLLFSTHDRDLLKSLRTDEVVLIDKHNDGASSLATASDFRGVRTRDDLRRLHEEGRLRGVPTLGDFSDAFTQGNA
jgi:uncharacterized protein